MNTQLLWDGVKAMILGMGMVYLFLIIMIWIMNLTSELLKPYAGFLEPKPKTKPSPLPPSGLSDDELARAAAIAVQMYRKNNDSGRPAAVEVPFKGRNVKCNVSPADGSASAAPEHERTVPSGEDGAARNQTLREVKSPLPGTIVKLNIETGTQIAKGDVLAVIEAMKMETEIRSEFSGFVRGILTAPKEVVVSEQTIMLIEETK